MIEAPEYANAAKPEKNAEWWFSCLRFIAVHFLCLVAFWIGFDWVDVAICLGLFWVRLFFITAGYHRYFSHRTFKTSRVMQFILAFMAETSAQKGVLWWSAHHRHHHKESDTPDDVHSVRHGGFWWAHVGWIFHPRWGDTDYDRVKDLAKYPELVWLDDNKFVPPLLLALACFLIGGWTGIVVWFLWSTVILWHATFTINSLSHYWGARRYDTSDDSKNNFLLALLTFGEGWHNNHHHYSASVNQGWFWWQVDITYYILWVMDKVGLVWDLRTPPEHVKRDVPHPVKSFRESAARIKQEALESLEELVESASTTYSDASKRIADARASAREGAAKRWAEAARVLDEKARAFDESMGEVSDRFDDSQDEVMLRVDARVEEITEGANARIEELKQKSIDAQKSARRAVDQIQSTASTYMEEIDSEGERARREMALTIQSSNG